MWGDWRVCGRTGLRVEETYLPLDRHWDLAVSEDIGRAWGGQRVWAGEQ